jgi:hypothetical protein
MKRKMISALALTLLVLTSLVFVSCQDFLPVADDATVKEVVSEVKEQYKNNFRSFIIRLAERDDTPEELEGAIKIFLEEKYEAIWGADTEVDVTVGNDSISATVDAPDGKNKLDINFSRIDLDTKASKITGKFSMTISLKDVGAASVHTTEADGDFTTALKDTVTFSTVSFRGTSYDTDAFNKEMAKEL